MGQPAFAQVEQRSMRDSVYFQLHDAFARGEFAPGDVLSLRRLADQLGTSLTPVREAVRRLVAEGALVDTPSRTLKVPEFDRARMTDLKRARLALEPLVLELALQKDPENLIEKLTGILENPNLDTLDAGIPDLAQNYDFHFTLYNASDSPVLLPLIESLWLQYGPYLNLIVKMADSSIGTGNNFHEDIINSINSNNYDGAVHALIRDIERSFDVLNKIELQ